MLQTIILVLCIVLAIWLIFSHFGTVWKVIYNSILGMLALMLVNLVGTPFGWQIGINAVTCLVCGILGLPGFIMLFILRFFV